MIEHIESEREVVFNYFKNYLMFIFSKILVNLSDLRLRFFFIYQKKIFKFMKKRVKFPLFLNFNKFKILKVIYEKFVFCFFSFRKLLKKNNLKKMKIKNFIFCELKLKILYVDYFFIKIYMFYLYFIFLIKNKIVKERFCLLNYFCKFLNKFLLKNKIRFLKNRLFFFNINYNIIFEISNNFLIFYNEFIYKNLERKFNLCIFDIVIKINFVCGFILKKKINFLNKQIFNIKINFISLNKIYYLFFFKRFFEIIYFIKKSFKERGIRSFYKKKGRFKQLFLHYIIKKSFSFKKE